MEEITKTKPVYWSGEYFPCLIYPVLKMDVRSLKTGTSLQMLHNTFMKCIDFIFNWMKTCFKSCCLIMLLMIHKLMMEN